MENKFMKVALSEANQAAKLGEVPVGAAIFLDGRLISVAHNLCETTSDPCAHAEILAIKKACAALGNWRLTGASLYVTLEPCPMCAGAIILSRISSVYFGAYDNVLGAGGGKIDLFREKLGGNNIDVYGGILENECSELLKNFFAKKRK